MQEILLSALVQMEKPYPGEQRREKKKQLFVACENNPATTSAVDGAPKDTLTPATPSIIDEKSNPPLPEPTSPIPLCIRVAIRRSPSFAKKQVWSLSLCLKVISGGIPC